MEKNELKVIRGKPEQQKMDISTVEVKNNNIEKLKIGCEAKKTTDRVENSGNGTGSISAPLTDLGPSIGDSHENKGADIPIHPPLDTVSFKS